jgi:hypothetical protein
MGGFYGKSRGSCSTFISFQPIPLIVNNRPPLKKTRVKTHVVQLWYRGLCCSNHWRDPSLALSILFLEKPMTHQRQRLFPAVPFCLLALSTAFLSVGRVARADEPEHKKIDHAKQALTDAYEDLDKASDNFDGHKKVAMEKIKDARESLEKWHEHVGETKAKIDKALEELHVCKEKGHEHHPKIEQAIDALEAAKDELK